MGNNDLVDLLNFVNMDIGSTSTKLSGLWYSLDDCALVAQFKSTQRFAVYRNVSALDYEVMCGVLATADGSISKSFNTVVVANALPETWNYLENVRVGDCGELVAK